MYVCMTAWQGHTRLTVFTTQTHCNKHYVGLILGQHQANIVSTAGAYWMYMPYTSSFISDRYHTRSCTFHFYSYISHSSIADNVPAKTRHWSYVGLMLGQRRRCWPNNNLISDPFLMLAVVYILCLCRLHIITPFNSWSRLCSYFHFFIST